LEQLYLMVRKIKEFSLDESLLERLFSAYIDSRYPVGMSFADSQPTTEDAKVYLVFALSVSQAIATEIGLPAPGQET
jgi:hypothetical protein